MLIENDSPSLNPSKKMRVDNKNDNNNISSQNNESDNNNSNGLRRSNWLKPKVPGFYDENKITVANFILCAQRIDYKIPKSFQDIQFCVDKEHWDIAIKDELKSHEINETWTLVPRTRNKNIIDSKLEFTIKTVEFGNPVKHV